MTVKKLGNQKHYQASPESPIFEELCSIVRKTVGLREPLRAALKGIEDKVQVAILYGSTAKGTDTAKSDIDVLIVSEKLTLEDAINAFASAERLLDRRISCTIYSPREFSERRKGDHPFITRMLNEAHEVLTGRLDGQ